MSLHENSKNKSQLPAVIEPKPISWPSLFLNPYGSHAYKFEIGIPARELVQKLTTDTAPTLSLDCMMRRKPFYGSVSEDSFKVSCLQKTMKNSWAPVAVGQITSMGERTRVELKFRMNTAVVIFMFLWMGFAITGCIAAVTAGVPAFLPIVLFPVFGVVLCAVGAALGRGDQRTFLRYFSELPESQFIERSF